MDSKDFAKLNAYSEIFKAMAHPVRLFILKELSKGEGCVCDLKDKIGVGMSAVSKHLSLLKKAGLVSDEKRGVWVFYRLENPEVSQLVDLVENLTKKRTKQQLELVS